VYILYGRRGELGELGISCLIQAVLGEEAVLLPPHATPLLFALI
jgi:hypothetical protein